MVYLTRKIEFSASHLYHNPAFSPEENRRIFGKCNNPGGHGHNYILEVTVGGEADPQTGMVLDLKDLKQILETEIMERMDHRFLNYEVAELAGQIPTCENVAAVIWRLLEPKITRGHLHRVRLRESADLYVDCYGDGSENETRGETSIATADSSAASATSSPARGASGSAAGFGMTGGPAQQVSRERVGEIASGEGQRLKPPDSPTVDGVAEATTHKAQGSGAGADAGAAKPNGAQVTLTRRYTFAASHRLHSAQLDEAANRRIYGKCHNPYGHGHNYAIEVTVSGTPDPATGMIAHLGELDRFVEKEVLDPFDHKYLNEDVPAFGERVPTTENLCIEIFNRLAKFAGARLERIRVEETGKNSFEYRG